MIINATKHNHFDSNYYMNCPNGARQFAIIEMISTQIYLDNNTDTDTDRRHKLLEAKRGELASQPKPANAISMTYF